MSKVKIEGFLIKKSGSKINQREHSKVMDELVSFMDSKGYVFSGGAFLEELAKQGDTIEWDFKDEKYDDYPNHLKGNTFQANVAVVNHKEREYCVYAEYGMDKIPFNGARVIKRN